MTFIRYSLACWAPVEPYQATGEADGSETLTQTGFSLLS